MSYFVDYPPPSERPPQHIIDLAKNFTTVADNVPMIWTEGDTQVAMTYGELRAL